MLPPDYVKAIWRALKDMDAANPGGLSNWPNVGEVPITDALCRFLTQHGFDSRHQQSYSPGICDIVSALPGGIEVWIEAKLYWTLYFERGTTLAEAHSGEYYSRKIDALVTDCSTKLAQFARESQGTVEIAGLLIGFEKTCPRRMTLNFRNPQWEDISKHLRNKMKVVLPGWSIVPSDPETFETESTRDNQVINVVRPMLLVPPDCAPEEGDFTSMPDLPQVDERRAMELIDAFVMNVDWNNAYFRVLVRDLIEPLGLTIGESPRFCEVAGGNIRNHWSGSWDKHTWNSRRGPWVGNAGARKIIEIVRNTALDFAQ